MPNEPGHRPLDRLEHRATRWLASLPASVQIRISGEPPIVRDGCTLEPEMQLVLGLRKRLRMPALSELPPPRARRRFRRDALTHAGPLVPVAAVRDVSLPGPAGALHARHYAPEPQGAPAPLLVFFHGGGFVLCDLDTHDPLCRTLCRHAGVHVLSVAYRLAPEDPFPAAVDDACASFRWAAEHAADLGADPARVAVGGDSAGGNLAAVVAQLAAAEGGPRPAMQLLIYPAVDRTLAHASVDLFADGFFLTRDDIEWHTNQYIGGTGVDLANPRVSPLRARDLRGLAPALVVTAGFDPLRDEGEAYGAALRKAGVPALVWRFSGLIHGFANMTGVSRAARDATLEIAAGTRALFSMAPQELRSKGIFTGGVDVQSPP